MVEKSSSPQGDRRDRRGDRAPPRPADPARAAALALLGAVLGGRRLDEAADTRAVAALAPEGRARALRLASQTLRHMGRADALLAPLLVRAPPPALRNILRLGVVEMLEEGAPAHGVVNALAGIAREGGGGRGAAGLVNAVLRRVAEDGPSRWPVLPPARLPGWIAKPVARAFGKRALRDIEAAHARVPPIDLTPRAAGDVAALADMLGARALPTGSLRLERGAQISALPGFAEGRWWVQDAAAALPARLAGPVAGLRVVDACAAPGGKTLQLAAAGAEVTALDISQARLGRLRDNLARTGLRATVVAADALHWEPEAPADLVVLDAPCSASGTLRRHPDLPFTGRAGDLPDLVALQAALIDRALGWLAPGGRLIFCTCSLITEEGEGQVRAALARHPDLRVLEPDAGLGGIEPGWRSAEGGLRLRPDFWPEQGGMDGFYMALLTRAP